jgi:hypothetical protein
MSESRNFCDVVREIAHALEVCAHTECCYEGTKIRCDRLLARNDVDDARIKFVLEIIDVIISGNHFFCDL